MALTSALYTGLTGMTANQQKLNVIGNNIANVNTVAFKSSRALFKPQFYVTDNAGSGPTGQSGGINPSQRGMGAQVASIEKNFSPGSPEATGIATDLAIEGDGFFIVDNGETRYTRDGSFQINEDAFLTTGRGEYVMGYGVDKNYNITQGPLQRLEIPKAKLTIAEATTTVDFRGNLNAGGDVSSSASVLRTPPLLDDAGATPDGTTPLVNLRNAADLTTPLFASGATLNLAGKRGGSAMPESTFVIDASTTVDDFNAFLQQGLGIDTSPDVLTSAPAGYTPGAALATTTLANDPAGSVRLNITGNAGVANALSMSGALTSSDGSPALTFADDPTVPGAVGEGLRTMVTVYDSLGVPVNLEVTLSLESTNTNQGTTWRYYAYSGDDSNAGAFTPGATPSDDGSIVGTGTINFDKFGTYVRSSNDTVTIERSKSGASDPLPIRLNMTTLTSLATEKQDVRPEAQDGLLTQTLTDYSIGQNGDIQGIFSRGEKRLLGRVAIAQFDNPEGLLDQGSNNYQASAASGDPVVLTAGNASAGTIRSGALEQSNVDLSKEFIDMIVTTTGFSAASRVITTSNRLLDELLQTSR